jgi:hypothetical protein
MFVAEDMPSGCSRMSHARANTTNNGFPGGCGTPSIWPVAMYSLVSQNAVVGLSVIAYSANTATVAIAAAMYGARYPSTGAASTPRVDSFIFAVSVFIDPG